MIAVNITGQRWQRTNPRALGTNPRALGLSPRQLGVSYRDLGVSQKQLGINPCSLGLNPKSLEKVVANMTGHVDKNYVSLTGTVQRDVNTYTGTNQRGSEFTVANVRLEVSSERSRVWINVVAWDEQALVAADIRKGDRVEVEGVLQMSREWTNRDGQTVPSQPEVRANSLQVLANGGVERQEQLIPVEPSVQQGKSIKF